VLGPIVGWSIIIACVSLILWIIIQNVSDHRHHKQIGKWLNDRAAEEKKKRG